MPLLAIDQKIRECVLRQADYTCQACGATANDFGGTDKMVVGFIPRNDLSLALTGADLKALCPDCDEGFASAVLLPRMNAAKLQIEVRRATVADQLSVLDWLLKKYPARAPK